MLRVEAESTGWHLCLAQAHRQLTEDHLLNDSTACTGPSLLDDQDARLGRSALPFRRVLRVGPEELRQSQWDQAQSRYLEQPPAGDVPPPRRSFARAHWRIRPFPVVTDRDVARILPRPSTNLRPPARVFLQSDPSEFTQFSARKRRRRGAVRSRAHSARKVPSGLANRSGPNRSKAAKSKRLEFACI